MTVESVVDLETYKGGLRQYLAQRVPSEWSTLQEPIPQSDQLRFERDLYASPWFGVWLPTAIGGRDFHRSYQIAFEQEVARAGVEDRLARIGQNMVLPTLLEFGSQQQIAYFGPATFTAQAIWCQGFSEPNAGSDLAALQMKADSVQGGFRVCGQKTWTSLARIADYCFCLVRTDRSLPKHQGISVLLIDMRARGIEVRPIQQIDGGDEFSEVYFDGTFVSEDNLLGPLNGGWRVAMRTLEFERTIANIGRQVRFAGELDRLAQMVVASGDATLESATTPELGRLVAEADVLRNASEHLLAVEARGIDGELAVEGARTKLHWSAAHQSLAWLGADVAELLRQGGIIDGREVEFWRRLYLRSRAETIYAGTSQVQRDIIARRAFGLASDRILDHPDGRANSAQRLASYDDPIADLAARLLDRGSSEASRTAFTEAQLIRLAFAANELMLPSFSSWAGVLHESAIRGMPDYEFFASAGRIAPALAVWTSPGSTRLRSLLTDGRELGVWLAGLEGARAVQVRSDPAGVQLSGVFAGVVGARSADEVIVMANAGTFEPIPVLTVDTRSAAVQLIPEVVRDDASCTHTLICTDVWIDSSGIIGYLDPYSIEGEAAEAYTRLEMGLCVEMLGLMSTAFDRTVDYAREREQFGRKIGCFQAVQHMLADSYVRVGMARLAVASALRRVDEPNAETRRAVGVAKAICGSYSRGVIETAIQIHGGLGFTREAGFGDLLSRAVEASRLLGSPRWHERWLAREVLQSHRPA